MVGLVAKFPDTAKAEGAMRKNYATALLAASVLSILCDTAVADVSLSAIGMGHGAPTAVAFVQFQEAVRQYSASGERFRIDTHCPSACTMFLSVRNVCIAPGASLAFHAGGNRQRGINPEYTAKMLNTYRPALKRYLVSNRIMETLDFTTISGQEMISRFGYPACR
jgi:hypothetical protein